MMRASRTLAVLGLVAFSASLLSACATPGATTSGDAALLAAQERAVTEVDTQIAGVVAAESALDRLLLVDSGLAEVTGIDVDALLERMHALTPATPLEPAATPRARRATNAAPVTAPDAAEAANAATNGLSLAVDSIRDALGAAAQDDDSVAQFDSPDGGNPQIGWTVDKGAASGTITSTIADTGPDGTRFEMTTEGEYSFLVCPTAEGSVEGGIWVRSAITVTPPGGAPQRSVIELNVDLGGTSNDEAYTADSWAEGSASLSQGAPGSGQADLGEGATTAATAVDSAFTYGEGAKEVRDISLDDRDDTNLTSIADELTMKMQQVLIRMAEDYWRGGNCVRALVTPDSSALDVGDSTGVTVKAESIVDGTEITAGRSEWTGVVAIAGSVTPTEAQKLPGAFVFESADEKGWANPEFEVTTRRGIGVRVAPIEVGQEGWVLDGVAGDITFHSVKCDGLVGAWAVESTGPEGYYASSEFTLGDDLRGTYGSTVVGAYADAGEVWLTGDGGTYVFHATGAFDPALPLRPATNGECA